MEMDVNKTYFGDHIAIYANIKSVCCTPPVAIVVGSCVAIIHLKCCVTLIISVNSFSPVNYVSQKVYLMVLAYFSLCLVQYYKL